MKWNCWWSLVVVPGCLAWCRCMSALFSSPTSFALPYAHWAMHFILYTHLPLYLSQCIFASRLDSSSDAMGTTRTRPVACLPTRRAANGQRGTQTKVHCDAVSILLMWLWLFTRGIYLLTFCGFNASKIRWCDHFMLNFGSNIVNIAPIPKCTVSLVARR